LSFGKQILVVMNGIRHIDGGTPLYYSSGMAKMAVEKTLVPVDDLRPVNVPAPRFPNLPAGFVCAL